MNLPNHPTALLATFNKTGLAEFARGLTGLDWTLYGSQETSELIRQAGIPCLDVAVVVGQPVVDHRVTTLFHSIHAALVCQDSPDHIKDMLVRIGLPRIDLVYVNFRPLPAEPDPDYQGLVTTLDQIDTGGPALVMSAIRGRRIVVTDPDDLKAVLVWLSRGRPNEDAYLTSLWSMAAGVAAAYHSRIRDRLFRLAESLTARPGQP